MSTDNRNLQRSFKGSAAGLLIRPASYRSSSLSIKGACICEMDQEGALTKTSRIEGWPYLIHLLLLWRPRGDYLPHPAHLLIKTDYLKLLGAPIKKIFHSKQKELR